MRISDWSSDVCSSDLAQIADLHAAHDVAFDDDFLCRETRIDLHAQPFGLRRQPAAEIAQRDHVIPMIVHGFGDHEVEEAERLLRAVEKVQLVALDRRIERRAKFLPVREQLVERTRRSEEPTSELQSLMRNSYAV